MAPPTATYTETVDVEDVFTATKAKKEEEGHNRLVPKGHEWAENPNDVQVEGWVGPPKFTDKLQEREYLKGRLALAFRIFGKNGFEEGVAGHITLRDPINPHMFWVNPMGVPFSLIKASDLLLVDEDGKVVDGGPVRILNQAAFTIHSAIHKARPDVNCAAHCHSMYGRTFAALGKKLDMITQDSCMFYNDVGLYESFKGVVLAKEEGQRIVKAIGNKKACILQNHGLLTAASTIEAAIFWFVSLDRCCHTQLLADAAGQTKKIDEEDVDYTYRLTGSPVAGWFCGKSIFDVVIDELGDKYLK
ncbi:hypothetical protein AYO21_06357 [Fonsecaea monophora]|uniref:Class II aldolase/adducin N-terminal domain-containing protein n=1 Tax=Fonsecaea monophora TaxID=254056 RepID=A0A177F6P4_9EURO|nr:hypothetical protein AYO21_06357 [Fonsecaea monophora]KAH0831513.1 Decarboxylase NovR [Fonsecaea pedrosoi]OAG39341.1 hypothetical protein AYO21_06357 [Fonsecaea monophora]